MEVIHSKAPFRISFAGGGSDVSPYSEQYGGAVLNATINLYAKCRLVPSIKSELKIILENTGKEFTYALNETLPHHPETELITGAVQSIEKRFSELESGCSIYLKTDVPQGSGLGTSSTILVAILGALLHWKKVEMNAFEIAHLAYEIERIDIGLSGGKQDQYAASIGGINFIEFGKNQEVKVKRMNLNSNEIEFLQNHLVLYFTGESRSSAKIISEQMQNAKQNVKSSVDAMHQIREQAYGMKEIIEQKNWEKFSELLNFGWENKKKMAGNISNERIEFIIKTALNSGALGGKISGAGGGGFMFFYVEPEKRKLLEKSLESLGGYIQNFNFTQKGLETWTSKE